MATGAVIGATLGLAIVTIAWTVDTPAARAEQPARTRYAAAIARLEQRIAREMKDKALPAVSIALVEDQEIVWAKGFGYADPTAKTPATEQTVYRVGSVSKLFTDIAVMQLVEQGQIDLDAPVTAYLPDFQPKNPFTTPITLRQLMSHRAGLVREPPRGHYFDNTTPSLADTVRSLNDTTLVYAPGTHTKYSNAGIAVVGRVVEVLTKQPFPSALRERVLGPLGMTKSAFAPTPDVTRDLAKAVMWTYDDRTFPAPTFELGMAPAGSMYSTVTDLARFMSVLFTRGQGPNGPVIKPATLEAMWTPQFAPAGTKDGFGIGFHVSSFEGQRRVGHSGAIYGFATDLQAAPDAKLGVAVVTTLDVANAVMTHIAEDALRQMLRVREGRSVDEQVDEPAPMTAGKADAFAGVYASSDASGQSRTLELDARGSSLVATVDGFQAPVSLLGNDLFLDGRLTYGPRVIVKPTGALEMHGRTFERVAPSVPAPAPDKWTGLIGEYGWDHNVLYILERQGKLHALIEWFFLYPLDEIEPDVYAFPKSGLYDGEGLRFTRNPQGQATSVVAAGITFVRRPVGLTEDTFKITPLKSVDELRRLAAEGRPPAETGKRPADLVELTSLDPTIKLDIRYATSNNFMGTAFYAQPRAFLQRPAAEALLRAHRILKTRGFGLLIHDGYRPWSVTKMFWEATPPAQRVFVADPSQGSRHNRGCAVDLTLYDLKTGRPVTMTGGYDEFSDRSYPNYPGGTSLQRWHREVLREAMEAQDFTVYEAEWWHFDYNAWREYPILNVPFEQVKKS